MINSWEVLREAAKEVANLKEEQLDQFHSTLVEVFQRNSDNVKFDSFGQDYYEFLNDNVFSDEQVVAQLEAFEVDDDTISRFRKGQVYILPHQPSGEFNHTELDIFEGKNDEFRVKLYGTDVDKIENFCEEILILAKGQNNSISGPVRLPTKKLEVPIRKSPNGEGRSTGEHWEIRVHKRLFDIEGDEKVLSKVMGIEIPKNITIEITDK